MNEEMLARLETLSAHERLLLWQFGRGLDYLQAAKRLGWSPAKTKRLASNMRGALMVTTNTHLALIANGIVPDVLDAIHRRDAADAAAMFPRPIKAEPGMCFHYSYDWQKMQPNCAAGMRVKWDSPALPCWNSSSACPCKKLPTEDQVSEWAGFHGAQLKRALAIACAIPNEGGSGTFPCPACKVGSVQWYRNPTNGNRQAKCSTPNCNG